MAIVAINASNLQLALQNDAQQMRTVIDWVNQRYQSYSQNCTTQNMTAAGIGAGDQNSVLAFIGDFNRLKLLMSGTLPPDATDMKYDAAAILGVL
jgi:hypothetical protein